MSSSSSPLTKRKRVLLALDVGSSSIRCLGYSINERNGEVELLKKCVGVRKMRTVEPNTGKILLETEETVVGRKARKKYLLDEIDGVVDDALQNLSESGYKVVGLGFTTFVMNWIGVDMSGQPVGNDATISYACNTPQVAAECQKLKSELGTEKLQDMYQRTGAPLHSAYALAQLRVLYGNPANKELCQKITMWKTLSSVCLARWRGVPFAAVSWSEASWTGLLNLATRTWDKEILTTLLPPPCRSSLPPLADFYNCHTLTGTGIGQFAGLGMSTNTYYRRWPLLRGSKAGSSSSSMSSSPNNKNNTSDMEEEEYCRFFLGVGDGACANIGSKCTTTNRVAVTIGTSAAARIVLPSGDDNPAPRVPPGLFCYRINQSHVLLGGALTDGGSVVEWARRFLRLTSDQALESCLQEAERLLRSEYAAAAFQDLQHQEPNNNNNNNSLGNYNRDGGGVSTVTVVPFLSGERSTGFRTGATLTAIGLTRDTSPAHFLKACLEGVVLRLAAIVELLLRDDDNDAELLVSGAALERNALWRQMLADCTGCTVRYDSSIQEATSRGMAILMAMSLGPQTDSLIEESLGQCITHVPRDDCKPYWLNLRKRQESLISAAEPIWQS